MREMSFQRILVAIDQSVDEAAVIDRAINLAKAVQARLMLFHSPTVQVNTPITSGISGMSGIAMSPLAGAGVEPVSMTGNNLEQQEFRQAVDQTVERLQRLAEQINAQGVPTEFDHKSGHPGEQICQLAKGWNADLIVVGRRGHKGLTEFLTGSTSNHVLHHAPCSVLIVQGTETVQEIETA